MQTRFDVQMKKVRKNLEVLHSELITLGYQFTYPDQALAPADPELDENVRFLEERIGPIPAALKAFYKIVGSVNFMGMPPGWEGCTFPDPIVVETLESAIADAHDYLNLKSPKDEYWGSASGVFRIPIAPDLYHKENVSGGMWYGVEIPNNKDDPDLLEEWHNTTFLGYLNICFEWAGFPGLEKAAKTYTWPLAKLKSSLTVL